MSMVLYAGVGALATVVHYAVLILCVEGLGWPPGASSPLGACAGAMVAYAGNRRVTFRDTTRPHAEALPRFAGVALVGAAGNGLIVGGLAALGVHYLLAQVVATGVVVVATYQINRRWTFT